MTIIKEAFASVNASRGAYTNLLHNFSIAEVRENGFTFSNPRKMGNTLVCDVFNPEMGLSLIATGDLMSATRVLIKEAPSDREFTVEENGVKKTIIVTKGSRKVYLL